jgi:DNA gyrase/topoisomerase IV subunit A
MVATDDTETQILTITKNGMAKRSRLGTSDKIQDLDSEGNPKKDSDGNLKMITDGYRRTRPGAKGIYTMDVDIANGDKIVSIKHIPNVDDNLFLLTKKGMMIRIKASQTKESKGKKSKGTRIMELRTADKTGYLDSIIFTARLPAELINSEEEE